MRVRRVHTDRCSSQIRLFDFERDQFVVGIFLRFFLDEEEERERGEWEFPRNGRAPSTVRGKKSFHLLSHRRLQRTYVIYDALSSCFEYVRYARLSPPPESVSTGKFNLLSVDEASRRRGVKKCRDK